MKTTLTIIVFILYLGKAFATGQVPDYLIQGQDTVPIFNNPLEQYFDQFGNRELINFSKSCESSGCWRGYIAYWELKNDSLFLLRITSCYGNCDEKKEANIFATFGNFKPFASWYNGTLTLPGGELFSGSDMGYGAIYEYEDKLLIERGVLKSKWQISNLRYIEKVKLDNKLYSQIPGLRDTLLFYLKELEWEKLDNSNCDCSDSYFLTYNKNGKISDVELIKFRDEFTTIWDTFYDWRVDTKCSKRIKSAIEPLILSYLNSHRDFEIEIKLFYDDQLEMRQCRRYYKPISQRDIKDYVRKQMEIK